MRFSSATVLVITSLLCRGAYADSITPIRVVDLDGQARSLVDAQTRATAIVFVATQCPISNRYVPMLNRLSQAHQGDGVDVCIVVSDPTLTRKDVIAYRDEYKITAPIVFDASGELARQFKPTHTPEAFVLDRQGAIQYRGRIDDGFTALGQASQVVKSHDLADAISAVLENRPVATARTEAVGCIFEALDPKAPAAKVTYTRDIAPILNANCVSCHRTGEVAPFPLTSYTDASKRAKQLAGVTEDRYMPPWKPAEGFARFLGEHRLSDREIELIKTWADSGAAQGNADDLPSPPKFASDWTLGTPDLVVKMPEPVTIPADGRDIYRAFVVPLDIPDDCYVAGVEFRAGAKSVVHHCLMFLDNTGAARKLDADDAGPGYKSFGGPGFAPTGSLGGWAPGAPPQRLPDGVGRFVRKNSDLVFQMHYHPDGREHTDQSSVAIYFQKTPIKQVISSFLLATRDIDIAPGDAKYTRDVSLTLPIDVTLSGITPHMHLVGREMKVAATTPDKKEIPLIWIKDWDFKWQGQYRFAEPIALKKGTRIEMNARYDNSDANPDNPSSPPKRVTRGEQTTDEMCICFIEFLADSQTDAMQIRRQLTQALVSEQVARRLTGQR